MWLDFHTYAFGNFMRADTRVLLSYHDECLVSEIMGGNVFM